MKTLAVIPARMASTRFPDKPLALIRGRPMIEHVYRRTKMSACVDEVVIATCDEAIARAAEAIGARAVLTSPRHERATDRIAEAAQSIPADIVINVQGDEPMLQPDMLDCLVAPLQEDGRLACTNLMLRLTREADLSDPNQVKVVLDQRGNALYMSREAIPTTRYLGLKVPMWRQLGLMAFRSDFLQTFAQLLPTPYERAESVDMMRAVEHGYSVRMVESPHETYGVDTPADLARVETLMGEDPLCARYV